MDYAMLDSKLVADIMPSWVERNVADARAWWAANSDKLPAEGRDSVSAAYAKALPYRGHPQEALMVAMSIRDADLR